MDVAAHITALREHGQVLADAAVAAGLDAAVPSCPDWVVRDLVQHIGGVHRWATGIVSGPRIEAWNVGLDEVVGSWPPDADLVEWFRAGHARLVEALTDADPGLACWTFLAAPSPRAMWARRQAHETAIHRVDAELAAGRPSPSFAPAFAADGIDELLTCFITRGGGRLRSEVPRTLAVRCTDADAAWLVRISEDPVVTIAGSEGGDCTVAGTATDLYLALWNRGDPASLTVDGATGVFGLFRDSVHIRWS